MDILFDRAIATYKPGEQITGQIQLLNLGSKKI